MRFLYFGLFIRNESKIENVITLTQEGVRKLFRGWYIYTNISEVSTTQKRVCKWMRGWYVTFKFTFHFFILICVHKIFVTVSDRWATSESRTKPPGICGSTATTF